MSRKFCMCVHSLPCPAAAIVFPNCEFQYFSPHCPLQFYPAASSAFPDTCLSKVRCARPFSDLHGVAGEQAETLCLISRAQIYLVREPKLSRRERLPLQTPVLYGFPRLCLALCHLCAEQEDVQHLQYILRGLAVSSCLWL